MRKIIVLTALLLCVALLPVAHSQTPATTTETTGYSSTIELQKGEKWWGIFISNAPIEPFLKPFKVNTANQTVTGQHISMMLSSNGRYIWSDSSMEVEFDGKSIVITSDYEKVEVKRGGKNLREAYLVCCHKNFPPEGSIPDVSMFVSPQYDTSIELGLIQGEKEMIDYAAQVLANGLPAGVLVISDGWRAINNPYAFDSELYPDPKRMIETLHTMGFKVMLTITPYTQAFGRRYAEDVANDYLLRDSDNKPVAISTSGGFSACYDVSLPQQAQVVADGLKALKESYPIDGFRFDCRDVLPLLQGSTEGDKVKDFVVAWMALGEKETLCEYLPGGMGKPFLGSYISSMENQNGVVGVINDMILAGLAGFPYSHVSSFVNDTTELFTNQTLMSEQLRLEATMPVMKIGFAPWRITDKKLYSAVMASINLRMEMGEYISGLLAESERTAEPLIRHMEYQFPRSGFYDCNNQFMLGPKYLFAVNAERKAKLTVRLPRGQWVERSSGRVYKGPRVTEINVPSGGVIIFELKSAK